MYQDLQQKDDRNEDDDPLADEEEKSDHDPAVDPEGPFPSPLSLTGPVEEQMRNTRFTSGAKMTFSNVGDKVTFRDGTVYTAERVWEQTAYLKKPT